MNEMVKGSQLGLGDQVQLGWPYGTATVVQIKDDEIRLIRPYVHTSDVRYSGNQVLWYLGIEDFKVSISGNFVRVYKSEPPR